MRIMLDPHRHNCNVWFSDGNLQVLKGSPEENCARIARFVMSYCVKSTEEQLCKVFLDDFGMIGRVYRLHLEDIGVKVIPIIRELRIV